MNILTLKQINSRIKSIGSTAKSLRDRVHVVLCSIAGHAYMHGDVTKFDDLLAAATGMNRHEIAGWIKEFGFAQLSTETGKFVLNKSARSSADFADAQAVFDHLMENERKWYEGEKDAKQVAADLDVAARLQNLVKSISKAPEKDRKVKIDLAAIDAAIKDLQKVALEASAQ